MKNVLLLILCICLIGFTSAQQINLESFNNDVIKFEAKNIALKTTVFDAAPTQNYDIKYHSCFWNINPDTLMISGNVFTAFELTENTDGIYFDAGYNLIIDSVLVNELPATFVRDSNAVKINFGSTLVSGSMLSTRVYYHGNPASSGFGSFVKGVNSGGNIIWTLSEPYGASDWWPCKQTLNDKIDSVDIFVNAPTPFKAAGPGLLIDSIPNDSGKIWHWKSTYPVVTYLIGIAVSTFETFQVYAPHHEDSVLFYNMVYPESLADAIFGVNAIIPSFELFSDIYGDYPFAEEKYGHMQFGWGGGMEHQTMSSVTHFGYDLLVHEMAHQWFGDKITCASWSDIWLNEGFATYSTWLSYDFSEDPNHYFEAWLSGTRNTIVSKPDGSVWIADTTLVSRIFDGRLTYYKGGWLLHMLRSQLGDEDFFAGIKNYITDPDLIYGFVTTTDLISHLEAAADTSLAEFFSDWFYGEGFPTYHILWDQDENGFVTIALDQETSSNKVDFFEMDVPIRLKSATDSIDVKLKHEKNGQLFSVPVGFPVDEIILDPNIQLLHANDLVAQTDLSNAPVRLVIYPSPVSDILTIQLFSMQADNYTVTVYNNAAESVLTTNISGDANQAQFTIDVKTWPSGLYVIVVKNSTTDIVQKIIVN